MLYLIDVDKKGFHTEPDVAVWCDIISIYAVKNNLLYCNMQRERYFWYLPILSNRTRVDKNIETLDSNNTNYIQNVHT